jgi:hypothetical protein
MHACEDGHEFASMMAGKLYGAMMVMYNDMQHLIIRSFPSESSLVNCYILMARAGHLLKLIFLSHEICPLSSIIFET